MTVQPLAEPPSTPKAHRRTSACSRLAVAMEDQVHHLDAPEDSLDEPGGPATFDQLSEVTFQDDGAAPERMTPASRSTSFQVRKVISPCARP
jgi:hypothetical protein